MAGQGGFIDIEEATRLIMSRTGKTRRQARVALLAAIKAGKVAAARVNEETGRHETIPPKAFDAFYEPGH